MPDTKPADLSLIPRSYIWRKERANSDQFFSTQVVWHMCPPPIKMTVIRKKNEVYFKNANPHKIWVEMTSERLRPIKGPLWKFTCL